MDKNLFQLCRCLPCINIATLRPTQHVSRMSLSALTAAKWLCGETTNVEQSVLRWETFLDLVPSHPDQLTLLPSAATPEQQ